MTHERLAEIKARAEAATPGPWHVNGPYASMDTPTILDDNGGILGRTTHYAWMRENAAFMAAARSDVPDLVAEVERLRAENERLRDALRLFRLASEIQK